MNTTQRMRGFARNRPGLAQWLCLILAIGIGTAVSHADDQVTQARMSTINDLYGLTETADGVTFYVNTTDWAVVHYSINAAGQLNVGMEQTGSRNELTLDGLSEGDSISYWFTYNTSTGAVDTDSQTHTLGEAGSSSDSAARQAYEGLGEGDREAVIRFIESL